MQAHPNEPAVQTMKQELRSDSTAARAVQTVRSRHHQSLEQLKMFDEGEDQWTHASEFRGVHSYYKHDKAGRLWLRTQGVMDGISMVDCMAMWKELDLCYRWFPMCTESKVVAEMARCESVSWTQLAAPGLPIGARDAVLHGYGVDCADDGFFMIVAQSAKQADFPELKFPPVNGFGAARLDVYGMKIIVTPLSENRHHCEYIVGIDIKAPFVPSSVIHAVTQRLMSMMFHKLCKEAKRMRLGPQASEHAARMEARPHIYRDWMMPRMHAALRALRTSGIVPRPLASGAAAGHDAGLPCVPLTPSTESLFSSRS